MPDFKTVKSYLNATLGVDAAIDVWPDVGKLPWGLVNSYSFHTATILNTRCLLVAPVGHAESAPGILAKHIEIVRRVFGPDVAYLLGGISPYARTRLLQQKVPFIIPGNQMYLPMLAVDLQERFKPTTSAVPTLAPASQLVVLYCLIRGKNAISISELTAWSGYSPMTFTRVFRELQSVDLAEIKVLSGDDAPHAREATTSKTTATNAGRPKTNRQLQLIFKTTGRELWTQARQYMRSPIQKSLWFPSDLQIKVGLEAGFTALSQMSDLAEPSGKTFAVSPNEWKAQFGHQIPPTVPQSEPSATEIQIWRYNPALIGDNHAVDPFSLFLSLQDTSDERVQSALEVMMEDAAWSKDWTHSRIISGTIQTST